MTSALVFLYPAPHHRALDRHLLAMTKALGGEVLIPPRERGQEVEIVFRLAEPQLAQVYSRLKECEITFRTEVFVGHYLASEAVVTTSP